MRVASVWYVFLLPQAYLHMYLLLHMHTYANRERGHMHWLHSCILKHHHLCDTIYIHEHRVHIGCPILMDLKSACVFSDRHMGTFTHTNTHPPSCMWCKPSSVTLTYTDLVQGWSVCHPDTLENLFPESLLKLLRERQTVRVQPGFLNSPSSPKNFHVWP